MLQVSLSSSSITGFGRGSRYAKQALRRVIQRANSIADSEMYHANSTRKAGVLCYLAARYFSFISRYSLQWVLVRGKERTKND